MEGIAAEVADGAQRPSFVICHDSLRSILNDHQVMSLCNVHNGVHFTCHTGIVHGHNGSCPVRNGILYFLFIDVHGIGTDVHKHGNRTSEYKRIRRGYKGVCRHDDLIARFYVRQQGGKLCGMGTGSGKQAFPCARFFLYPGIALFGKFPIAAYFLVFHRNFNIVKFLTRIGRYIKINHSFVHLSLHYCTKLLPDCILNVS